MEIIREPKVELIAVTQDAERLIEKAARRCYFGPDFEALPGETLGEYLRKIKDRGHLSVFEHASVTFDIQNVSRVFLAQISRHRIASPSVESQRYRSQSEFDIVLPEAYSDEKIGKELLAKVLGFICDGKKLYDELIAHGMLKEDARYILFNGGTTSMLFTVNFREMMHILDLRDHPKAQKETRVVVQEMARLLHAIYPSIF